MTILRGAFLQRRVVLAEARLSAASSDDPEREGYREWYDRVKGEYCEYRATHFLTDW